jgi:ubiquinone/menaquinone biosynthesis C-methylase UbiE
MFTKSAQWYDALYSFKDYPAETEQILRLLREKHPKAKTLLDVACGTAEHDKYLSRYYQVDGIDQELEFIRIAAAKNPDCHYYQADMTDFNLSKTYDILLCLFSSIGYVRILENVVKALACFKRHLNPGGILLVEPWFTPETWNPDHPVRMLTAETGEGCICRMNQNGLEGSLSILNFHYLLGQGKNVQYFTERHELGLFTVDDMQAAFRLAGFKVTYDPQGLTGRGLYLAE